MYYVLAKGTHAYQIIARRKLTIRKLVNVYQIWRDLQKNAKKLQDVFKRRQQEFVSNLDNLLHIAHTDALQLMKIEEDGMFLQRQREPGRPGHLGRVNKKRTYKEERARLDRCQLSMRDSVFILEASIDALGCNIDEFPISKSSIQRIRTEKWKERVVALHWDGKLLL
ncbi:hypothetical protein AVEN_186075-1 [Araneus ventricosus]|uniref:Uncharacterized protein n=1 Tax=Araneus ventricosus TaxID=182803 RepID=A0A4Y2M4P4_ARAVE|nr:hypothetical protein AVEN_186075-1 [Araneus ventricosus]